MPFLHKRFEECRKASGLTLAEIATQIGVETSTVQRYEKGKFNDFYLSKVEELAVIVGCDPAYLVGWQEEPRLSTVCATTDYQRLDKADKTVADTVITGLLSNDKYASLNKRRHA